MKMVSVPIVSTSSLPLPAYATAGSSGMDLRAAIDGPMEFAPMQRALVPTGIRIELPQGYEAQVRPRSGLAIKQGFTCLNTPGTIDADYRGEIQVILVNLSGQPQTIQSGDRIAQLVVQKVERVEWIPVAGLSDSERSDGGFGSTGSR